jgi:adenine-specific DNA methylase
LEANAYLHAKRTHLGAVWGIDPLPDEIISTPTGTEYKKGGVLNNFTPVVLYGMTKWRDLFNSRQKLALLIFVEKVRQVYQPILAETQDEGYTKAIVSYLAVAVDRLADHNSSLSIWVTNREATAHPFMRQALSMTWDYLEINPLCTANVGCWKATINWIIELIGTVQLDRTATRGPSDTARCRESSWATL